MRVLLHSQLFYRLILDKMTRHLYLHSKTYPKMDLKPLIEVTPFGRYIFEFGPICGERFAPIPFLRAHTIKMRPAKVLIAETLSKNRRSFENRLQDVDFRKSEKM